MYVVPSYAYGPLANGTSLVLSKTPTANGADGSLLGVFTMLEKPDFYNTLAPFDQLRTDGTFMLRTLNQSYLIQPDSGGGAGHPIAPGERLVLRPDQRLLDPAAAPHFYPVDCTRVRRASLPSVDSACACQPPTSPPLLS